MSLMLLGTGPATPATKPTNITPPSISGVAQQGQTATVTPGTYRGTQPITLTYQWYNSSTGAISGATGTTYTFQSSDSGDFVYCAETAANPAGRITTDSNSLLINLVAYLPLVANTLDNGGPMNLDGLSPNGSTQTATGGPNTGYTTLVASSDQYIQLPP